MAFGESVDADMIRPNAEINMIPLVDVMLVLLVIFIITAPLLTHAIRVDLPEVDVAAKTQTLDVVELTLDDAGALHWNGRPLERADLGARLREVAAATPQPRVQLRAARATQYQALAEVMAAVQNANIRGLGLITTPVAHE